MHRAGAYCDPMGEIGSTNAEHPIESLLTELCGGGHSAGGSGFPGASHYQEADLPGTCPHFCFLVAPHFVFCAFSQNPYSIYQLGRADAS